MVSFQEQIMKPNQPANYDHTFRAIHDDEFPWREGSRGCSYHDIPCANKQGIIAAE
jgi:hypothetical protein